MTGQQQQQHYRVESLLLHQLIDARVSRHGRTSISSQRIWPRRAYTLVTQDHDMRDTRSQLNSVTTPSCRANLGGGDRCLKQIPLYMHVNNCGPCIIRRACTYGSSRQHIFHSILSISSSTFYDKITPQTLLSFVCRIASPLVSLWTVGIGCCVYGLGKSDYTQGLKCSSKGGGSPNMLSCLLHCIS